jgi:glycosyltransferase involved in cell wall biosynthesis
MKVALVHDWLNGMRGGEKCLEVLCEIFPDAIIYTLHEEKDKLSDLLKSKTIVTSFIQKMPFRKKKYRYYLPLFPKAIETFDLSDFDLVVSISHCVAKGVKTSDNTCHICYCLTPMRYAWGFFYDYFGRRFGKISQFLIRSSIRRLKCWDIMSTKRVDYFLSISENITQKIRSSYNRDSMVVYPPVDVDFFFPDKNVKREDFFLIVSAFAPYKKLFFAVETFNSIGLPLVIIGSGEEKETLNAAAMNNIKFHGWCSNEMLRDYYRRCKALVFPGKEDFGIVPLEAQACGAPVLAYKAGGALETVIDGKTGLFFKEHTLESLKSAVYDSSCKEFNAIDCRNNAETFSRAVFKSKIEKAIIEKYSMFREKK